MNQVSTLEYAADELRKQVVALGDAQLDTITNCDPWTIRQLASHAVNIQLMWAGTVSGQELVDVGEALGAVAHDGDLTEFANDAVERSMALWQVDGVLEANHVTLFGELAGSAVIDFPTFDAICHAWDIAKSLGKTIEFSPEMIPALTVVMESTCNDGTRAMGLIGDQAELGSDASATAKLMALAGRS